MCGSDGVAIAVESRAPALADLDHVLLAVLAGGQISGSDAGSPLPVGTAAHLDAVLALRATPGAWLSQVLERRKADVPTLPNELRFKQQTTPLTTDQVSTSAESDALIDLLSPASVALASGIQRLSIDITNTRVPRSTGLPQAGWIPELGAFPRTGRDSRWSTWSRRSAASLPRSASRSSRTSGPKHWPCCKCSS